MTPEQALQIKVKVAKALGWTELQLGNVYGQDDLDGQGIYAEPFSNYQLEKWTRAGSLNYFLEGGELIGKTPSGSLMPVPDWPNDLPMCMAPGGPWEWLKQVCTRKPSLHTEDDGKAWICAYIKPTDRSYYMGYDEILTTGRNEAEALCRAVLTVAEKMREQTDDSKG